MPVNQLPFPLNGPAPVFSQPIQPDIQAANLFIRLPQVFFSGQDCSCRAALKKIRHLPGQLLFPDRDLGGMHLELFGQLLKRMHPLHRLQGHLRLKFRTMPFPLLGHLADPSPHGGTSSRSTILTDCPNIGVHYSPL